MFLVSLSLSLFLSVFFTHVYNESDTIIDTRDIK